MLFVTASAFSSSVLVNMHKVRLQKLRQQNALIRKMEIRFAQHINRPTTIYTHQFGIKLISALAKHLASRRNKK